MKSALERIQSLRDGQSLAEFCKAVGLNYERIKKCFQDNRLPDAVSLSKIALHFRTDLLWLVTGQGADSSLNRKIATRIQGFRSLHGDSLETLSHRLSLPPHVLSLYEQGKLTFSLDLLEEWSQVLNVRPQDLLAEGRSQPVQRIPELRILPTGNTDHSLKMNSAEYISIPLTRSSIAAGQPIIQENDIEDYVLLHIRAAGKRSNLVASRVDGNSMEPMLHSGDIVVIDRNAKSLVRNKIFAVYYENGLTAKFLERKNQLLILRPINPVSEVQIIDLNEQPDPIVGRIIGAWKEL